MMTTNRPLWREKNFWHVNFFGLIIFLIFTALIMAVNTVTKTMRDMGMENVGFYSMATLNLTAVISLRPVV